MTKFFVLPSGQIVKKEKFDSLTSKEKNALRSVMKNGEMKFIESYKNLKIKK